MAIPQSRKDFITYCMRKLGSPVIEINVDMDQVEFIDKCILNKYSIWYFDIIEKAIIRKWSRKNANCYTEKHHIFPESLGGKNNKNNLVLLTAKEHFICHLLLVKMLIGNDKKKMCWALNGLRRKNKNQNDRKYINSLAYSILKGSLKHTEKTIKKFSTSLKKRVFTEEHRANISKAMTGTTRSKEFKLNISVKNTGKKRTEEHKKNYSIASKGHQRTKGEKNPMFGRIGEKSPHFNKKQTEDHIEKRISKLKGRKQSKESRLLMSINRKKGPSGKKWFNNGIVETFDLPENKPIEYNFGRLKRGNHGHTTVT